MSIINTFDNKTKEIVQPTDMIDKIENFPEVAILVFKERFFDYLKEKYEMKILSYINAGLLIPIYEISYNGKKFAITRATIGGASTAAEAEELIAMGAKKILIFGTCGTLYRDILKGHFVIPTAAYRDEGTSYHYVEPSDFIEIATAKKLCSIFDELNIPYINGKTWTTDGFYRETIGNMRKRKDEGCIVVDMECASIMAVGQFRNIPIYQFLYGDDTLDGTKWDRRKIDDISKESMEKKILDIGFKVADKI